MISRAADRALSTQPGISTRHAFSAGAHYDPDNVAFGPVIGCDEHAVEPDSGFDWHAHRGVLIVSWVLDGALSHADDGGAELIVPTGGVLVQSSGDGIRHRELNASRTHPLRFVQTTLLLELEQFVRSPELPVRCGPVTIDVADGAGGLAPGDSIRDEASFAVVGGDSRLVVRW